MKENEDCTRAREIESSFDIFLRLVTREHKLLSCYFIHHNLLPNLFFSQAQVFYNFIGHVLDSVNKCNVSCRLPLVWCDGTAGFQRRNGGRLGCTSGPPPMIGLHHIIRKGNVYPTNTTGGPWKPKGNKGGTNSIEQPWTLTLSNCIRYSMLAWGATFWMIELGATSWEVYFWVL